MMKKGRKKMKN